MTEQQAPGTEPLLVAFDLSGITPGALRLLLMGEAATPDFLEEVLASNRGRTEILEILRLHPKASEDIRSRASEAMSLPVPVAGELKAARQALEEEEAKPETERAKTLFQEIKTMKTGERMLLAIRGGQEVRSILLKDANKEVVRMVLQNPKLTESEVDLIAKNRNISDDVLRIVSKNREWMKNYSIVYSLVANPKTPAGIASSLVPRLKKRDLEMLSKSRGVSEMVRASAKRMLSPKAKRS
jgi:hypothetical protein